MRQCGSLAPAASDNIARLESTSTREPKETALLSSKNALVGGAEGAIISGCAACKARRRQVDTLDARAAWRQTDKELNKPQTNTLNASGCTASAEHRAMRSARLRTNCLPREPNRPNVSKANGTRKTAWLPPGLAPALALPTSLP